MVMHDAEPLRSILRSELQKSALASNVIFGFILTGFEKLVETEFVCPCDPKWNAAYSAFVLVVPGILAFLLMINIRGCQRRCFENLLICSGTAMIWFTLIFWDGNYFVCAQTDWNGMHVLFPGAAPQKWCKPDISNSLESQEKIKSQKWFALSQGIGMGLFATLACAYLVYTLLKQCCCRMGENQVQRRWNTEGAGNEQDTNF